MNDRERFEKHPAMKRFVLKNMNRNPFSIRQILSENKICFSMFNLIKIKSDY